MQCKFCKQFLLNDTSLFEDYFICYNHGDCKVIYDSSGSTYTFLTYKYYVRFMCLEKLFEVHDVIQDDNFGILILTSYTSFFNPEETNDQIDRLKRLMVFI